MRDDSNPYAPPRSDDGRAAPNERGALEVSVERDLPQVCLKCGSTSEVRRHVVVLDPPGTRGHLLLLGWFGLLFWWLDRSSRPGSTAFPVPVCRPCDDRWKLWQAIMSGAWVSVVLSIFLLPVLPPPLPALLVIALVPTAAVLTLIARRQGVPLYRGSLSFRVIIDRIPRSALDLIAEDREREDARPRERERELPRRPPRRARRQRRSLDDVAPDERDAGR